MRPPIMTGLASGRPLVADGATGTMLQEAGIPAGTPGESWVLDRPDEISRLHRAYLDAGSDMILTSTFGATQARLRAAGLDAHVADINLRAAEIAREAAGDEVYVAGDIGPSGEMMTPLGQLTFESAVDLFAEQAKALSSGPIDCIYIETMSDLNEARAAVTGSLQVTDLPIFCTFSFDTHGRTGMGVSPAQAGLAMVELGVSAVGANCGHAPEEVIEILKELRQVAPNAYLIAKPNAGVPRLVKRKAVYDASPERMADLAQRFVEQGASIVGACCGSSPEHIAAIAQLIHSHA
jgi:methionine synthase I (cobalamin-dependent)